MTVARKPVPQDVEVWRISLDDEELRSQLSEIRLSSDESDRAAKFVRERDRGRFEVGRRALRRVLSEYVGCGPAELEFQYAKSGKPSLKDDGTPLQFNLTHCEDLMLVAITSMDAVGIDTERVRNDSDHLKIAERFFASREIQAFRSLPADKQARGFFQCWTRKEAFIKATGAGMSTPLDSFEVSLSPNENAGFLRGGEGWSLRSFEPKEGFVAAVVAPGDDFEIGWIFNL
jgi:4'-phosphopantetheinyl transferase